MTPISTWLHSKQLLERVEKTIHDAPNHVRYGMNSFVIAVGCYVKELTDSGDEDRQEDWQSHGRHGQHGLQGALCAGVYRQGKETRHDRQETRYGALLAKLL